MTHVEDMKRQKRELLSARVDRIANTGMTIVLAVIVIYVASQVGLAAARGKFTHIPKSVSEATR